ncbi:metallophosphoesterase [Archaeoglobales archaeon]|nr:MAG: metallophosphoesterase [Archaeoglobales archaeon]
MVKFVHMADIHLGNKQYGSEERQMDFAQAFLDAIKFAVEEKVDFILIAGDLFHKKTEMDPVTLLQARKVLEIPKEEGIPVIGVEGNHDSTYFRDSYSWMDYLAVNGLMINLKPSFEDGKLKLEEWNGKSGAYYEFNGIRIYGMKYYGSISERIIEEYFAKMRSSKNTIFMAHIGVEGYVRNMYGCIPSAKIHKLGRKVDYIALGHVHKAFVEKNLVFNPGSLEACDITEIAYERGIFVVDMENDGPKATLKKDFYEPRDFVILKYRVKKGIEGLKGFLSSERKKIKLKNKPVIDLTLDVERSLRNSLEEDKIKELISEYFDPLLIRLHWDVRDHFRPTMLDLSTKESIERSVVEQLLDNYKYGKIAPEVLKLKKLFSTSFDLEMVDRLIDDLLFEREDAKSPQKDSVLAEELKDSVDSVDGIEKLDLGKEMEKSESDIEEEEVWDWRRACDKGGRPRKRKKL